MKTSILLIVTVVIVAGSHAGTQAQYVGVYPDTVMSVCWLYDIPGVVEVHVMFGGALVEGVRFKIEASPGMTMTYLSETHHAPVLEGNTQDGITFCLGQLRPPPVLLATIRYMGYETSEVCSEIVVVPHPDSNTIDTLYDGFVSFAYGVRSIVRVIPECGSPICGGLLYYGQPESPHDFCAPLRSEEVTWGEVKVMYR